MFRLTRMKLDRAKQRMKELEEALQSFYATNPFKFWFLSALDRYREDESKASQTLIKVLNIPVAPLNHLHRIPGLDRHQRNIAGNRNAVGTE